MLSVGLLMLALGQTGASDAVLSASQVGAAVRGSGRCWRGADSGWERRVAEPILPLDLFADRLVRTTTISGFLTASRCSAR